MTALQIGILGAANIARQFTAAVAGSPRVAVAAVASRGADKAAAFAAECAIPRSHSSYEAMLADPAIEAVYIPLPNHLHAEWAIQALKAGKHVLSEKPLALNADEVGAIFAAARAAGRIICEGYPWLAQPQTRQLRDLLDGGTIGAVRQIAVSLSAPFSDPANIRMQPGAGGGALLDLGSYCVSLLRFCAGTRPLAVTAQSDMAETGVDRGTVATLSFPGGVTATLNCSFAAAYQRSAVIQTEGGSIATTFRNHAPGPEAEPMRLWRGGAMTVAAEELQAPGANGFRAEAESFADAVQGRSPWTGADEAFSTDVALTLDAIAASARTGARVTLPATERRLA